MTENGMKARFSKPMIWFLPALLLAAGVITWFELDRGSRDQPQLATDAPKDDFERRVRGYLLEHPEIIMEAVNRLEARQPDRRGERWSESSEGTRRRNTSRSH
jgi:hypothetical protein